MPAPPAWHDVPPEQVRRFADLAMERLPDIVKDILRAMGQEYPNLDFTADETGRPKAILAISLALENFVQQLTETTERPSELPEIFKEFGGNAALRGRSLDSLQAIYRLNVRLAWRSLAEIGQQTGIPPPAMYELAESAFEYLDELVSHSVRGYAEAAAGQAGERIRRQRLLMDLLLTEHHTDPSAALAQRAAAVDWDLPDEVAVAVLLRPSHESVSPALGDGALLDTDDEQPRLILPDPDTPGRLEQLHRATAGWSGALGPTVPVARAATSLRWAALAARMIQDDLLPQGRLLHCSEHAEALVLLPADDLLDDLARRRLAPLADLGPGQADRLAETLLAWLETQGSAPAVATRLGVHAQTVRYRLRQIRDLWGEELDDPDRRFELELVLRTRRLRGRPAPPIA
ncbi:PucR family transcriptional regulator [Streptomyces luteolifulvus]|uniref:PucR family transcriptional regulator n=1 Tax=Streptomyces luteolifulvus TaxID=2615112 RepID=A0A6H9URH4_9ACTN|nr:helix-turn-helix domain-containing protein [Streptomyces luteolifulvus]KAB1140997.1 PucR family transcriptional regulator [Streptomyces luteolifulvus]